MARPSSGHQIHSPGEALPGLGSNVSADLDPGPAVGEGGSAERVNLGGSDMLPAEEVSGEEGASGPGEEVGDSQSLTRASSARTPGSASGGGRAASRGAGP